MYRVVILNFLYFSSVFAVVNQRSYDNNILKSYSPSKIEKEQIVIDGKLNEKQWNNASSIVDFVQLEPNFDSNPTHDSEVKIIYDDGNIYFGIILYDIHKNISYKNGEYDDFENIFFESSDYFTIEIDSFFDLTNSYGFAINSSGVQADYIIYDNEFYNDNWNGVWYSEVSVSNQYWIIECKIPINNLRFDNESNLSMGMNFMRYIKRNNEYISWTLLPSNESDGIVSHYGELSNLNFNINKYFSIRTNLYTQKLNYDDYYYYYEEDINGNISGLDDELFRFNKDVHNNNVGINFKYLINSNTAFDLLINPDYSNIEQDQSEINTSAYETYYDEKRPFFLEQSQIFSSPIEIFYSRRIGLENFYFPYILNDNEGYIELESRIELAFKFASKNNKGLSYGVIGSQSDISNNLLFQKDNKAYQSIFRLQKEILNNNSYIGFLNTNFNLRSFNSNVYAIDGLFSNSNYGVNLSYQFASSHIENEKGFGGALELNYKSLPFKIKNGENTFFVDAWLRYDKYDKNFNIDYSGYLFRNNLKSRNSGISLNINDGYFIPSSSVSLKSIQSYNLDEVLLDKLVSIDWYAELKNYWSLGIGMSKADYAYIDRLYDEYFYSTFLLNVDNINIKNPAQNNYYLSLQTDLRKKVSIKTVYNYFINSLNDDGEWIILSSKFKISKSLDVEFIIDNLDYYKTYQFLKIRKVSLPNSFSDDIIENNYPREEYWHLFTNSDNNQSSMMVRVTSYIKNSLSIKFYAEYFKYTNNWNNDKFYVIDSFTPDFSYPDEYPSSAIPPVTYEDILLYSAKYSSLHLNFSIDYQLNKKYFLIVGYQYNKSINGYDYNNINDIISFNSLNIDENNRAEIFYDDTFFIRCEMLLGNSF